MPQRRRARIVLVVLVLVALVVVTIDFRAGDDGVVEQVRGVVTSVLRPVQDGVMVLVRPVVDGVSSIGDVFNTASENRELRERVEVLEQRRRTLTDLERENDELRRLLDVAESRDDDTIAARVVALAPSTFEWTVTLDVGSDDGVRRGMPVIDSDGLVGRVVQVGSRASRVLLAIDPNFSAAARLAGNGEIGPIDGRGGEPMTFRPLDPDVSIEVGDELVTSAYQGGMFPAGLPIGTVSDVGDATVTGLRREVQVQPFVDFTRLHNVLVVVHEPVEELPPLSATPDEPFTPPDVPPFLVPDPLDPPGEDPDDDPDAGPDDDPDADPDDDPDAEAAPDAQVVAAGAPAR